MSAQADYKAIQRRLFPRVVLRGPAKAALLYEAPIGPEKPSRDVLHLTTAADSVLVQLPHRPSFIARKIAAEVCEKWGFTFLDLVSDCRVQALCRARQELAYRLRKETTWSFPQIAKFLGGRDHTTVLHGYRKHAERMGLPL